MPTKTERLQASSLYKIAFIILAVAVGTCGWMVVMGMTWPVAAVMATLLIAVTLGIGTWSRRRS